MSAATSPGPNNLILLAVLGIGAYYLMTRRAVAQPVYANGRPTTTTQEKIGLIGAAGSALGQLFKGFGGGSGSVPLLGTYDGRAAQPWDVTPQGADGPRYNNPSAYVSGGADGLPVNPPFDSAYDFSNEWWNQGGGV
jgi:hypothetical protein